MEDTEVCPDIPMTEKSTTDISTVFWWKDIYGKMLDQSSFHFDSTYGMSGSAERLMKDIHFTATGQTKNQTHYNEWEA